MTSTHSDLLRASEYTWRVYLDFFEKNNLKKDDIVIVIGDHQPAYAAAVGAIRSYKTLVHVLSKNKEMINKFVSQGYSRGVVPQKNNLDLKHDKILIDSFKLL